VAILTVQQKTKGRRPKLAWQPVDGAQAYYLWLERNGRVYLRQWASASETEWEPAQDLPGGNYLWRVRAWNRSQGYGPWSEASTFTIAVQIPSKIVQIAPAGPLMTNQPTFIWTADEAATRYQFRLTRNGRLATRLWVEGDTTLQLSRQLTTGFYRWWVRGWSPDGFGPWSVGMEFSYGIPVPLSPTGIVSETRQPEFLWSDPVNAGSGYCLRLFRNGAQYRTVWLDSGGNWVPERELPAGNYRWWIRTWNAQGYGQWSRPAEFVIPARPPEGVVPLAPQGEVQGGTVSYRWQADPGATRYQLRIVARKRPWQTLWVESTATVGDEVSLELSGHVSGNSYTWWVRGWNADGFGPWSEPLSFTVR